MPRLVSSPTRIPVPADKLIDEYIGRVNTKDTAVSIAHMHSPSGWSEPGQQPEFDEYTVVLKGSLRVESKGGVLEVKAGQAVIAARGEWVRYSTPGPEGAEYIAVCLAAFDPAIVHRDD
ncbi:MAG: cupin domain-containing protein [Bryobacteraceae bacterium]